MKRLPIFIIIMFLSSCAQLYSGRTYLTEMEHEEARFFNPNEDFPVVAGDNGEFWMNERDRRARTPASIQDLEYEQNERALRSELRSLEESQSEESLELYLKHKDRLGSVSERIYFLKLSPFDRREYLESRGLLSSGISSLNPRGSMISLRSTDVFLGMSKNEVIESWGRPHRVDVAGNPRNENERWAYKVNGATKYIYFESGQVQGWE